MWLPVSSGFVPIARRRKGWPLSSPPSGPVKAAVSVYSVLELFDTVIVLRTARPAR